jgi:hypothetical protein
LPAIGGKHQVSPPAAGAKGMTPHRYGIYYESRELANELGDPLLGTVEASSTEEALHLAHRNADILRRAMPCASLWAVRLREEADRDRVLRR